MSPRSTPDAGYDYGRACPRDWQAAAQVWFGSDASPQQIESFLETNRHDKTLAQGWWVARRDHEIAAVQLVVPQAGAMAVCWPPTCRAGQQHHFAPLWKAIHRTLHNDGVHLFQCLVPVNDAMSECLMGALGFDRITELVTMRCRREAVEAARKRMDEPLPVALEPVLGESEPAFAETLFATYAGSLDAPEMDQYQNREDTLTGYAAPSSRRWLLRDTAGLQAGTLVLTEQDRIGQMNYLGIVPEARRKGLAQTAVAWALAYFSSHDVRHILVRLDARNEPALRLYAGCGFVETSRDVLFLSR
jgi:GNAT superfamily N-acetyltransferase